MASTPPGSKHRKARFQAPHRPISPDLLAAPSGTCGATMVPRQGLICAGLFSLVCNLFIKLFLMQPHLSSVAARALDQAYTRLLYTPHIPAWRPFVLFLLHPIVSSPHNGILKMSLVGQPITASWPPQCHHLPCPAVTASWPQCHHLLCPGFPLLSPPILPSTASQESDGERPQTSWSNLVLEKVPKLPTGAEYSAHRPCMSHLKFLIL